MIIVFHSQRPKIVSRNRYSKCAKVGRQVQNGE
jgi:hypothetical protein